jgi:hypothetical protein
MWLALPSILSHSGYSSWLTSPVSFGLFLTYSMEGLYALIILNVIIETPSRKYPSEMNNTSSEFPEIADEDVVIGITVPAYNKGNPIPATAIGTIPLCTIGRGIVTINTSVSAITNFEIIELSWLNETESNICTTDILTKSKSSTLNKLIASRRN